MRREVWCRALVICSDGCGKCKWVCGVEFASNNWNTAHSKQSTVALLRRWALARIALQTDGYHSDRKWSGLLSNTTVVVISQHV